jgi:pimeloyl-ACP methyl ester carboxylesterase
VGEALAAHGYYVVAPFMRGYAPSSLSARNDYRVLALASDAVAIARELGGEVDLIGHDWGAAATYPALSIGRDVFRRAVAMSVPTGAQIGAAFLTYPQLRLSWYMFLFQHPLSDVVVGPDFIRALWRDWSPEGADLSPADACLAALDSPERMRAALSYYRASLGGLAPSEDVLLEEAALSLEPMRAPVLYLHGDTDGCMDASISLGIEGSLPPGSRREVVAGAGHFLHLDQPAAVNSLIRTHLAR